MKKLNNEQMENLQGGEEGSLLCRFLKVLFTSPSTPRELLDLVQGYYIGNCQGGGY